MRYFWTLLEVLITTPFPCSATVVVAIAIGMLFGHFHLCQDFLKVSLLTYCFTCCLYLMSMYLKIPYLGGSENNISWSERDYVKLTGDF